MICARQVRQARQDCSSGHRTCRLDDQHAVRHNRGGSKAVCRSALPHAISLHCAPPPAHPPTHTSPHNRRPDLTLQPHGRTSTFHAPALRASHPPTVPATPLHLQTRRPPHPGPPTARGHQVEYCFLDPDGTGFKAVQVREALAMAAHGGAALAHPPKRVPCARPYQMAAPYFYISVKEGSENEVENALRRKFAEQASPPSPRHPHRS